MALPSVRPVQERLPRPADIFYDEVSNDPLTYRYKRSTAEAFPSSVDTAQYIFKAVRPLNFWDYACRWAAAALATLTGVMTLI